MPYTRYLYGCKPAVLLLVLCFVLMYNIARATPLAKVSAVDGATADSNVRFAGHVGGGSEAVYVTGSKAYVGEGPSLVILDITDPAKLIVLGKTAPGPGFITDVMVVGQYAYMVDSFGDLRIVDVTDPAQPRTVGLADTPGYSNGVYVLGALAFLANGFDGLRVVNVANPLAPSEVGAYDTPGIAYGVVAVGNFAFVADGSSGLRIINVATPTTPSEAGFYDTPDDARGLDVANNIAYVADGDSGLQIINVTNPTAPTFLGAQDSPFYGLGAAAAGNLVYLADGAEGLRVINVANPAAPSEVGFFKTEAYAYSVFAVGSTAYIGHSGPGVRIVDVSQPNLPHEIGYYHRPGTPLDVFVKDNLAYLADGSAGLRIVNLNPLSNAYETGYIDTPYHADRVYVSGNIAYVADLAGGLRIVNVANPAAPVEIGAYASTVNGVFVAGNLAYVASSSEGLVLLDVTNPASPVKVGAINPSGTEENVQVIGTRAYLADGGSGLRIIDVANPASPTELGFYDTPGYAHDVVIVNNIAYIANGDDGIFIVNVSNPAAPQLLGALDTQGSALDIAVANNVAYVADYTNNVRVIDIANPAALKEVGFYEMPGDAWGVFAQDNTFYVAASGGGLFVLRYPACYKLTPRFTGSGALPTTNPNRSAGCQPGEYLPGTLVTLIADPAPTWRVAGWVGTNNDNSTNVNNLVTMPGADHAVTVNYAPTCYLLTLNHSGAGADPTSIPPASPGCTTGQYVAGATITLLAAPNTGQVVGSWSGTTNNASTTVTNTVTMPGADHASSVTYIPACYALTLSHSGLGSDPMATPANSSGCPAGRYHFNETITLSGATPDQGWQIGSWSGTTNNASTATSNSVLLSASDQQASVNYSEIPIAGPGDNYESDNSCTRSRTLAADGSETQVHTFHAPGDADWVRLTTQMGVTYRIEVQVPVSSTADVNLEVYAHCEDAPVAEWKESFSPGARLDVPAPANGQIYVRLTNQEAASAGNGVSYQLSARALSAETTNRALIILAGRLKGADNLQKNIHNVTNAVYTLFQRNGYSDDNIQYLATDATLPGRDDSATKENLRIAITQWAKGKINSGGVLTLYLMDHGSPEIFYIDDVINERLAPTELDGWLSELETALPGVKINVIMEACQSGSFITLPGSLSKRNRVIITSTNDVNDAKASKDGAYFSDHLLTWLHQGYNLLVAFDEAKAVVSEVFTLQQAQLDANGNGIPNELSDGAIAASRSFAYAGTFGSDDWPPHIFSVQGPITIANFKGVIQADVRDNQKVRQVWAVVYPPDYTPPPTGQSLQAETLPTFLLTPVDNGNLYAGEFTGFTQVGRYHLVVQAEDQDGLVARPVVIEVNAGSRVFLPMVRR